MSETYRPGDILRVTDEGMFERVDSGWLVIDLRRDEAARRIAQSMDDQFGAQGLVRHGQPDEEIVVIVQTALRSLAGVS